jgi:SAM-dependent methyltransferase
MIDFDRIRSEEGPQAERLAVWFETYHKGETILDMGCGPGIYVEAMRRRGLAVYGVDNDSRLVESEYLRRLDIIDGVIPPINGGFGVVLSLEVGEHIPEADAGTFIGSLTYHQPPAIYFSAARPGQGGDGHVNCQIKAYWLHLFCERGYYFHPEATEAFLTFLRSGPHMGWAVQNAMILERAR